jgi:hypothetical protein
MCNVYMSIEKRLLYDITSRRQHEVIMSAKLLIFARKQTTAVVKFLLLHIRRWHAQHTWYNLHPATYTCRCIHT